MYVCMYVHVLVLYVNSCPEWYGKNALEIQSVVYCFGCEGKGDWGEGAK